MSRNNTNLFDSPPITNNQFGGRPNMKNYNVNPIRDLLANAKTVAIAVPQLSVDGIAAGLALGLLLKKKGLDVKVYCPQHTDNNYSKLSGLDLLIDNYASNDLIISLNHPLDQIENVSYNDDGGHLNLVVKTKPTSTQIQNNQIVVNNASGADVAFMLGDETSLGPNANIVNRGNWIFISPANINKVWAKATLIDPDAPFSEIFSFLLPMLGLEIDPDSGKNLLIGLRVATQSFSMNVSPESFEAGAICLRATQVQPAQAQPATQPVTDVTPIENVEKSAAFIPGTNKPNPTPTN